MSRRVCETPRDHAIQTGYELVWIVILLGGLVWFINSQEKQAADMEVHKVERQVCPTCRQKLP
jgi:hypothetical protein